MMFNPQTVELKTENGQPLKVHLISTGGVIVKTKFRDARFKDLLAKIDLMLDKKFTGWLPIWVMVIEHPEGVFVIDTGENSNINDPDYFKAFSRMVRWFNTTQYKFRVERDEEIDRQLESLNISPQKIKSVILTHLHLDHVDGLRHFPETPIIVSKAEWDKPYGDLPALYPSWFKPQLIELKENYDVFDKAYFITEARDLILVETPGHTWHHCSVILKTAGAYIVFGADVCYNQQQLVDQKYAGANASHKLSVGSYSKLRSFCKNHVSVFIPSHEADAATRLAKSQPIIIS